MAEPRVWTDVMGIADDLAQFARRVEDKLTDMERMTLDNLVLRLDTLVDRLPAAIHNRACTGVPRAPVRITPMPSQLSPGQTAYAAYWRVDAWTFAVLWHQLTATQQAAWEAAAQAVRDQHDFPPLALGAPEEEADGEGSRE